MKTIKNLMYIVAFGAAFSTAQAVVVDGQSPSSSSTPVTSMVAGLTPATSSSSTSKTVKTMKLDASAAHGIAGKAQELHLALKDSKNPAAEKTDAALQNFGKSLEALRVEIPNLIKALDSNPVVQKAVQQFALLLHGGGMPGVVIPASGGSSSKSGSASSGINHMGVYKKEPRWIGHGPVVIDRTKNLGGDPKTWAPKEASTLSGATSSSELYVNNKVVGSVDTSKHVLKVNGVAYANVSTDSSKGQYIGTVSDRSGGGFDFIAAGSNQVAPSGALELYGNKLLGQDAGSRGPVQMGGSAATNAPVNVKSPKGKVIGTFMYNGQNFNGAPLGNFQMATPETAMIMVEPMAAIVQTNATTTPLNLMYKDNVEKLIGTIPNPHYSSAAKGMAGAAGPNFLVYGFKAPKSS